MDNDLKIESVTIADLTKLLLATFATKNFACCPVGTGNRKWLYS